MYTNTQQPFHLMKMVVLLPLINYIKKIEINVHNDFLDLFFHIIMIEVFCLFLHVEMQIAINLIVRRV